MCAFENSKWISHPTCNGVNTYTVFKQEFESVPHCEKYTLRISVDTNYALYVNDAFAGTGQYADYPFDKVYDELDITELVKSEKNILQVFCYHQGDDSSTVRGEAMGLIFQLVDGNENTIVESSGSTLSAVDSRYEQGQDVEHITGQLGYGFHYDSRADGFDFEESLEVEKPLPARLRPIKRLVIGDDEPGHIINRGYFFDRGGETPGQKMQLAAMASTENSVYYPLPCADGIDIDFEGRGDGVFALIDLKKETAGILSLDIDVPEDAMIYIGWGEHLEDLRVRTYVMRNFAVSYMAHKGRNIFVHCFRRLGLRYLQLHIYAKRAKIRYAGIKPTCYPMKHDVKFSCADNLHNKIYEVCKRTLLLSFHEHYEDCPWREQAMYSMDSRNQMLCGYYTFKEFDTAKASIRLIAQSLRDDNLLELCFPARVPITIPSFSAIFLTQVREYVEYSGDTAFAREMLPYMLPIAEGFISRMSNEYGLLMCFEEAEYWNFYEWQEGLEGEISVAVPKEKLTYDAPLCAFVSFGLKALAETLELLGDSRFEYYNAIHQRLNRQINKYFWSEEQGAYASFIDGKGNRFHYCELTNALVAYADAPDGERLDRVLSRLSQGSLIPVTLSHSIFKYEVLMKKGGEYARYVFRDIADKWGHMLYCNATTFWETIQGAKAFDNAGSLCHGWSATPAYFYLKYAAALPGEVTGLYECRVYE